LAARLVLTAALLVPVSGAAARARAPADAFAPTVVLEYSPPLDPVQVLRPFDPPVTRYGAGHLGVDLHAPPGAVIHAPAAGAVTFAGAVAGRGVVVLQHADGIRTEYEPVRPLVRRGAAVARGQPIGRLRGAHSGCVPGRCLHWGARRGGVYLDPLTLLRPLGPVRLLPWS
jgi:murein DD-endopeptidase MepM/ murein hydrolase activator NlpD